MVIHYISIEIFDSAEYSNLIRNYCLHSIHLTDFNKYLKAVVTEQKVPLISA
jgi:hypothetical protein